MGFPGEYLRAVAVTGHRTRAASAWPVPEACAWEQAALFYLSAFRRWDADAVVCGMAVGADAVAAEAALGAGYPLVAAVPFLGQERLWPRAARDRYRRVLACASRVEVVSAGGYAAWKMHARNAWMIDRAVALAAVWDGRAGGTAGCVAYAVRRAVPVSRLDPSRLRAAAVSVRSSR